MSKQLAVRKDPTYAPLATIGRKRPHAIVHTNLTQTTEVTRKRPRSALTSLTQQPVNEHLPEPSNDSKQRSQNSFHPSVQHPATQSLPSRPTPKLAFPRPNVARSGNCTAPNVAQLSKALSSAIPSQAVPQSVRRQGHPKDVYSQPSDGCSMPDHFADAPIIETSAPSGPALSLAEATANHRKDYEALLASPEPSRWSPVRPQYVDPMLQTSTRIKPAGRKFVGRPTHDGLLESGIGVVLSEVEMIALPFGSVIELTNRYPEEVEDRTSKREE